MIVKDHRKLARIMAINEVSFRELSAYVGWKSHTFLHRLCSGEKRSLEPEAAAKIAVYLGVEVSDLFEARGSNIPDRSKNVRPRVRKQATAA